MERYRSNSGKESGATGFELGDDFIIVAFPGGRYKYTYGSCGPRHVQALQRHALASRGLSTYIAKNDPRYASKW
ncbi:MAG TPA: hypothetical protein PL070_09275 [Flavobacteriales bacterium]|nr:hypothetical protein [Flavobacteriales bacterium]